MQALGARGPRREPAVDQEVEMASKNHLTPAVGKAQKTLDHPTSDHKGLLMSLKRQP